MTNADYNAFSSSLNEQQRNYVQLYMQHIFTSSITPLINQCTTLISQNKTLQEEIKALTLRVNNYENNFKDDAKYSLTRAKVIALLKAEGIN